MYIKKTLQQKIETCFAFDTETTKGKAFFLTHSSEFEDVYFKIKNKKDVLKYFKYLFDEKLKIGFCYNLDYDIMAICTYFKDILIGLHTSQTIVLEHFTILYLKNKCFKIKNGLNKNAPTIYIYDIQQFYNTTLKLASEKYLPKSEIKKDIGEARGSEIEKFYNKNPKKFIEYAIQDARSTYLLAKKVVEVVPTINQYYSSGFIVYKLKKELNNGFKTNLEIDEFVRPSYFGGRIEFLQRGTFTDVNIYDIKSAYPSNIKNFENIIFVKFSNHIDKTATYHIIKGIATVPQKLNIGIFPHRNDKGLLIYPCGTFATTSDSKTIDFAKKVGCKFKILKVLNVYTTKDKPYQNAVNELFELRSVGTFENYFFKKLLNSAYGKKAERKREYVPINQKTFDDRKDAILTDYLRGIYPNSDEIKLAKIKNQFFEVLKVGRGRQYNIIEASLITSLTRLKLVKITLEVGVDNVIGFMTDSIFLKGKIPEKYIKNKIGFFELQENVKDLLVLGSGVYQTDNKTKMRGFNSKIDLKKLFKSYKSPTKKVVINVKNKVGLGTYLRTTKELSLNNISENERDLKLNFDSKRIWKKEFDTKTILKSNLKSKVICI